MSEKHSKIGASGCERWWQCPGSVALSENVPKVPPSQAALQGTAAHWLAEHCFKKNYKPEVYFDRELGHPEEGVDPFYVDEDMVDAVQLYLDTIQGVIAKSPNTKYRGGVEKPCPHDFHAIEAKVALTHMDPGAFGTADFVHYSRLNKELTVVDFKYGAGIPVDVINNKQLLYYALGAYWTLANETHRKFTDKITLGIIQPRAQHKDGAVRWWTIDRQAFLKHEHELRIAINRTRTCTDELNPGTWCRFCPAKPKCPALAEKSTEIMMSQKPVTVDAFDVLKPELLTDEQVATVLNHKPMIQSWMDAVEAYALAKLEKGETMPGYKLTPKQARRKWVEPDKATATLRGLGFTDSDIYKVELRSPAQIEKVVKKATYLNHIAEFVKSESSGNKLVSDKSPRPTARPSIETAFQDVIEEPINLLEGI